eukprot:gnl/TRDRNA2_/TRDRNA2_91751_c0_seq1.p1 gnl/TRDRNA2_/TRDRNA2_91751_c0~~gnl/TRDRNA2_/TRDRNA2_91751_c0_seq1.p1  ORF type:complete len:291 (+),score=53.92 gnl/TRDRNA2_/TRDRNA2_91751_c0_seq1:85-957(+)
MAPQRKQKSPKGNSAVEAKGSSPVEVLDVSEYDRDVFRGKLFIGFNVLLAVAALFILGLVHVSKDGVARVGPVHVLTSSNWTEFHAEHSDVVVEFYGRDCEPCRRAEPIVACASWEMMQRKSTVTFARVNASKQKKLARQFEIGAWPTLVLFKDGAPLGRFHDKSQPFPSCNALVATTENFMKPLQNIKTYGKFVESLPGVVKGLPAGIQTIMVAFLEVDSEVVDMFMHLCRQFLGKIHCITVSRGGDAVSAIRAYDARRGGSEADTYVAYEGGKKHRRAYDLDNCCAQR